LGTFPNATYCCRAEPDFREKNLNHRPIFLKSQLLQYFFDFFDNHAAKSSFPLI